MTPLTMKMGKVKRIALVAHDNKKPDLLEWARFNRGLLEKHGSGPPAPPACCCRKNWA